MARTHREQVVNGLTRLLVRGIDLVNRRGKSVGVRLVKLTGKSPYAIHPKHLVEQPWHDWYVPYLSAGDRVLDVGTSNGAHLLQAAPHCRSIVGVDYDVAQLTIAGRAIRERALGNARVFAWDLTGPLPFADKAFDTVLFLDVIEHLRPRVTVLREIRRLLVDSGQLLVSAPNSQTRWRATLRRAGLFAYSDPDHKIEYAAEEFVAELRAAAGSPRHAAGRGHRRGGWAIAPSLRSPEPLEARGGATVAGREYRLSSPSAEGGIVTVLSGTRRWRWGRPAHG